MSATEHEWVLDPNTREWVLMDTSTGEVLLGDDPDAPVATVLDPMVERARLAWLAADTVRPWLRALFSTIYPGVQPSVAMTDRPTQVSISWSDDLSTIKALNMSVQVTGELEETGRIIEAAQDPRTLGPIDVCRCTPDHLCAWHSLVTLTCHEVAHVVCDSDSLADPAMVEAALLKAAGLDAVVAGAAAGEIEPDDPRLAEVKALNEQIAGKAVTVAKPGSKAATDPAQSTPNDYERKVRLVDAVQAGDPDLMTLYNLIEDARVNRALSERSVSPHLVRSNRRQQQVLEDAIDSLPPRASESKRDLRLLLAVNAAALGMSDGDIDDILVTDEERDAFKHPRIQGLVSLMRRMMDGSEEMPFEMDADDSAKLASALMRELREMGWFARPPRAPSGGQGQGQGQGQGNQPGSNESNLADKERQKEAKKAEKQRREREKALEGSKSDTPKRPSQEQVESNRNPDAGPSLSEALSKMGEARRGQDPSGNSSDSGPLPESRQQNDLVRKVVEGDPRPTDAESALDDLMAGYAGGDEIDAHTFIMDETAKDIAVIHTFTEPIANRIREQEMAAAALNPAEFWNPSHSHGHSYTFQSTSDVKVRDGGSVATGKARWQPIVGRTAVMNLPWFADQYLGRIRGIVDELLGDYRALFMDNLRARHRPYQKEGKLHTSALARVPTGFDRPFKRITRPDRRSFFVLIAADQSGSTQRGFYAADQHNNHYGYRRWLDETIMQMALIQAAVLDELGIPYAFYSHSWTSVSGIQGNVAKMDEVSGPGARLGFEELAYRTYVNTGGRAANLDVPTIRTLHRMARARRETDIVICYYTDGGFHDTPEGDIVKELDRMKRTQRQRRGRIRMFGVGVGVNDPVKTGLDSVVTWVPNEAQIASAAAHGISNPGQVDTPWLPGSLSLETEAAKVVDAMREVMFGPEGDDGHYKNLVETNVQVEWT